MTPAFLTKNDLLYVLSEVEQRALAFDDDDQQMDRVIDAHLAFAEATVLDAVRARYGPFDQLPLSLAYAALAIARHRLLLRRSAATESSQRAHDDALAHLRALASGEASLYDPEADADRRIRWGFGEAIVFERAHVVSSA